MILSSKNYTTHFFDIESSDANFAYAAHGFDIGKFLRASESGQFPSHPYFKVHARSRLVQLYGTRLTGDAGFIQPGQRGYQDATGGRTSYHVSSFSRPLQEMAEQHGQYGEVHAVHQFYTGLESSRMQSNKPVALSGWNMGYDLSGLEAATHRHESLKQWRGYFARAAADPARKLHLIDSSDSFFSAVWKYGQHNTSFAQRYFGGAAGPEGLRTLSGWGVENVANAMGGAEKLVPGFQPHLADWDTRLTEAVSQKFADLHDMLPAHGFDEAMAHAGIIEAGQTAENFFSTVFQNVKQAPLPKAAAVEAAAVHASPISGKRFAAGLGLGIAAMTAYQLAFSNRSSRQTSITGLQEGGLAADLRHQTTDFGSGYRGIELERREEPNASMRTALILAGGAGVYSSHRYALRNSTGYASKLYDLARKTEDRSPMGMFRTFRLSEALSSHQVDKVHYGFSQLVDKGGHLTNLGHTIQRMGRGRVDVRNAGDGLTFVKKEHGTGYLHLEGHEGVQFRFTSGGPKGSTMGGAARRFHADLGDPFLQYGRRKDEGRWSWHRRQQNPSRAFMKGVKGSPFTYDFHPTFSKLGTEEAGIKGTWNKVKSAYHNASLIGFEFGERFQHTLAQMGLGLRQGSYNKLFHVPFFGEGGLVNRMLTHRALPAVIAYQGIKWIDYKLGHKPSEFLASIPLKARVAHAEATDRIPGARGITDFYKNTVPGPQYGPLAMPIGGMFLGGLYTYSKVLRGIPHEEVNTLAKSGQWFEKLPRFLQRPLGEVSQAAGIGALVGAALALPFVPGMLGDRKTAAERRRIYSGEELVPVKQGRWWEMGPTPFAGGRIKYFRQHWFAGMKAHAEAASLYGSEKEAWDHSPWRHPLRWLKDPYYLEKKHYRDRPYPVTSPAFSNVPLLGPLLAATIGKLVKPVRQMHRDEWQPGDDYSLFGKRMDPKGPRVESKFEGDVRQILAHRGYAVNTQEQILNYRADFTVRAADGRKIAIEADGERYHRFWRQKRDDKRQRDMEREGWTVLRLRSGGFWNDPESAVQPVIEKLKKYGVPTQDTRGLDTRSGLAGYAAPTPTEEFSSVGNLAKKEAHLFADMVGLPGFIGKSIYEKLFPDEDIGKKTFLEGSRNMTATSRRYYEKELGALPGPNPGGNEIEAYGYSEGLRRFIQPEHELKKVNPLRNEMPSWIPGPESMVNLHEGDPYASLPEGYARLPGAGYAALHPGLIGVDPEHYSELDRFKILADVAPYSKQFAKYRDIIRGESKRNTGLRIEYERTMDQVQQVKDSGIPMKERRFTGKTETITGTIRKADEFGFELDEMPGRHFSYSSIGTGAADLSAIALGNSNSDAANADQKRKLLKGFIADNLAPGTSVNLTAAAGTREHASRARVVVEANGININRTLIQKGLARERADRGGPESRAMYGSLGQALGSLSEGMSFTGDESPLNPLRYVPQPYNSKLWQNRSAISQYEHREMYDTPMRRWQRPVHDFLEPYLRGIVRRVTGKRIVPEEVQFKRDLNTLTDTLKFLRGSATGYTNESRRTSLGSNLFSSPESLISGLSDHESAYFRQFLGETNLKSRKRILEDVSPELSRALTAQWVAKDAEVSRSDGKPVTALGEGGRLFTREGLDAYKKAKTDLDYGDFERSREVAEFFSRTGFKLPDAESGAYDENIDYQDVKARIIQQEGYELHDFNIFDDRASQLWRKPYLDGTVRELTSGDSRSVETLRQSVEKMMIGGRDKQPKVRAAKHSSHTASSKVKVTVDVDQSEAILKDARRNPDKYQDQEAA